MKKIKNYQEYLYSDHWQSVKKRQHRFLKHKCFFCPINKKLENHHIVYRNIGNELIYDLVYLCRYHHDKVTFYDHDGFFARTLEKYRLNSIDKANKKYKKLFHGITAKNTVYKKRKLQRQQKNRGLNPVGIKKKYGIFSWKAK